MNEFITITPGFVFETVADMKDAIDNAKAATLRDARKELEPGMQFSFRSYLLAMDANGLRIDGQEQWHFKGTPSKRAILKLSAQFADQDHTINAYYDLCAGTIEERLAGNYDELTDHDAEIVVYHHKFVEVEALDTMPCSFCDGSGRNCPTCDEQELIAMSDCESISKPSTGKEENNMAAKSTWTGTPARQILEEALAQQNANPITVTEQAVLAEIIRARENGASVIHFDALATDDDTTTFGDLVDALAATR